MKQHNRAGFMNMVCKQIEAKAHQSTKPRGTCTAADRQQKIHDLGLEVGKPYPFPAAKDSRILLGIIKPHYYLRFEGYENVDVSPFGIKVPLPTKKS